MIAWWWTYFRLIIAPGNIQYVNFLLIVIIIILIINIIAIIIYT